MRIRTSLAILALALGGLLALATPAYAQEGGEERQLSEDTEHCIELAEEADDPEACQEAPNPILPDLSELVWGAVSFTALFLLLRRFAYPQIKQMMENRAERIRSDLASAESTKADAEQVLAEYRAQLNDAKAEAGRIIEEARQAADAIKRDQETRLQSELADLRGEVAQLAIGAAETVVQRSLDEATQTQLVEDYINQVAAQRS